MKKQEKAGVKLQIILIALVAVLLVTVLIWLFAGGGNDDPAPTATASGQADVTAGPTEEPTPEPTPSPLPTEEPTPTFAPVPSGFADVTDYVPDAVIDIRYSTYYNFMGRPANGYKANRALLCTEACRALKNAADSLRQRGYRIYIFDAYRPRDAVLDFVEWGKDPSDTKMKQAFYPNLEKEDLFKMYISSDSNHSRGGTIDMTIVRADLTPVDMGTGFDWFGEEAHMFYEGCTEEQKANRALLREAMENAGFSSITSEWWHFVLKDTPYTEAFNFPVE